MLCEGEELTVPALEVARNDPVSHIQDFRDVHPVVWRKTEPAQEIEMNVGSELRSM